MRTTVTIEKDIMDKLMRETKAKTKASAVREAIREYLRLGKKGKIKAMKGRLDFNMTADEIRHDER